MKNNVYKELLTKEAYYEKKMRRAEIKVEETRDQAKKNSQETTIKILQQAKKEIEKQEKNLATEFKQQIEILNKQTENKI